MDGLNTQSFKSDTDSDKLRRQLTFMLLLLLNTCFSLVSDEGKQRLLHVSLERSERMDLKRTVIDGVNYASLLIRCLLEGREDHDHDN